MHRPLLEPADFQSVELRDRRTGRLVVESADLLVGADGINSAVRAQLHPDEGPPIWNGIHLWRGVTETAPFLGGTMILSGFNPLLVAYPVSREAEPRGRSAVNWGVGVRLGEPTRARLGDWHQLGGLADVLPHVADRCFAWLDVPALVRGAAGIWEYPMVDRAERVHRVRREPMNALVLANRQGGPERVMQLVEERAPNGFVNIEDVMTRDELDSIALRYRRTAAFDAEALNVALSWNVANASPGSGPNGAQ